MRRLWSPEVVQPGSGEIWRGMWRYGEIWGDRAHLEDGEAFGARILELFVGSTHKRRRRPPTPARTGQVSHVKRPPALVVVASLAVAGWSVRLATCRGG